MSMNHRKSVVGNHKLKRIADVCKVVDKTWNFTDLEWNDQVVIRILKDLQLAINDLLTVRDQLNQNVKQ